MLIELRDRTEIFTITNGYFQKKMCISCLLCCYYFYCINSYGSIVKAMVAHESKERKLGTKTPKVQN